MDFDWHNSLLVSGDKNGTVAFWDINVGKPIKTVKCHKGSVSNIYLYSDNIQNNLIATGGINVKFNTIIYKQYTYMYIYICK